MAKYSIESSTLTNIADAIRSKTGANGSIKVQNMASEINGIESEPTLQTKTVTPTTSSQNVTPDSGYDGLSKVTVNAMPTAAQATPSISVNSSGLITASATQTAGYVAAGTKSGTKQLTTQAAKTVTPSTSSQTAVAKGVYTTGAVTVGAIPSTYVKPTTTKSATTYTPTTSNQTIAAGTYCSGAQTIKGDANLKAENIKSGVSIFGVTGTHSGGGSDGAAIETCTGTLTVFPTYPDITVYFYYIGDDLTVKSGNLTLSQNIATITTIKNSFIFIRGWIDSDLLFDITTSEQATLVYGNNKGYLLYFINGDNFELEIEA